MRVVRIELRRIWGDGHLASNYAISQKRQICYTTLFAKASAAYTQSQIVRSPACLPQKELRRSLKTSPKLCRSNSGLAAAENPEQVFDDAQSDSRPVVLQDDPGRHQLQEVQPKPIEASTCLDLDIDISQHMIVPTTSGYETNYEIFNPRKFIKLLSQFLDSTAIVLRFEVRPVFQILVPHIASQLGLSVVTVESTHKNYLKTNHNLCLVKDRAWSRDQVPGLKVDAGLINDFLITHYRTLLSYIRISTSSPTLVESSSQVVLTGCRNKVEAMPVISLSDESGNDINPLEHEQYMNSDLPGRIVISNSLYAITISRDVKLTTFEAIQKELGPGLLEYCDAVYDATKSEEHKRLSFARQPWTPAEFIGRATSLLNWGAIKYKEKQVSGRPNFGAELDQALWECSAEAADHGQLGPKVIWYSRKVARQHAIMHACAELKSHLQAAYEKGRISASDYAEFAQYWDEDVDEKLTGTYHSVAHDGKDRADGVSEASAVKDVRSGLTVSRESVLNVDSESLAKMVFAMRDLRRAGFEGRNVWLPADMRIEAGDWARLTPRQLQYQMQDKRTPVRFVRPRGATLQCLPVLQPELKQEIITAIDNNDVTIIKAATGSGKTTQIPQLVFDQIGSDRTSSPRNLVCTQPRRVSAVAVARRVAEERGQQLGLSVGYQVRFDDQSPQWRYGINYMTSGYLLRMLENDPNTILSRYTHIVLDEVHERDIDTDLLMTAIKKLKMDGRVPVARFPKIVLMSATIDTKFFEDYFKDDSNPPTIATVSVPGRTFSVKVSMLDQIYPELRDEYLTTLEADESLRKYLQKQLSDSRSPLQGIAKPDDNNTAAQWELLDGQLPKVSLQSPHRQAEDQSGEQPEDSLNEELGALYVPQPLLLAVIDQLVSKSSKGDLLVFLPGISEIDELEQRLQDGEAPNVNLNEGDMFKLFKLHSSLYATNYDVWKPVSSGCRRIVLATNIAETSITLPEVEFVIDTGLSRQSQFDQSTQTGNFGTRWISKAEVAQRKGRAGRTQDGAYFATYSQKQYDTMRAEQSPELLRTNLESIVLRLEASKAFTPDTANGEPRPEPGSVLALAPTPPSNVNVEAAAWQLRNLHALTAEGTTTNMGQVLSHFPVSPASAKSMLLGAIFRCLDPMMVIASMREDMPLLSSPNETGRANAMRRELAENSCDDRIADLKAFSEMGAARNRRRPSGMSSLNRRSYYRMDNWHHLTQTCNQIYETMLPLLDVKVPGTETYERGLDKRSNRFPDTPGSLNTNRNNIDLIKALSLSTSGSRLAQWDHKHWQTPMHPQILPSSRSVNHANNRRTSTLNRLNREQGDFLAFTSMRVVPHEKYPWACETSVVSPLMGVLFAESLRLVDEDTLVINDWARYRIQVEPSHPNLTSAKAARIILEYRKALDRFIAFAFSKVALHPKRLKIVAEGEAKEEDYNMFFRADNQDEHPLRKIVVESVLWLLARDSEKRKERRESRRQGMLEDVPEESELRKMLEEMKDKT